MESNKKLRGEQ
jgi:hypothetical protein